MRELGFVIFAVLALAGCSTSPNADLPTLDSGTATKNVAPKAVYTVAVTAVTVPQAIERPRGVTGSDADQVVIDKVSRGDEPVKDEIGRIIATELSQMLDGAYVHGYPQSAGADADCKVLVEVQRFDSVSGAGVTVEVLWSVHAAQGVARTGHTVAYESTSVKTPDALLAAERRALAVVSREIADAINAVR